MNIRSLTRSLILHVVPALVSLTCPAFGGEIHDAATSGNVEKVKALLKSNPDLVSSKDSNGAVPLHWAALNGHKEVAEVLLANNAAVDARESNGQTPLHLAVFNHHTDIAQLLLASKADVNAKSNNGTTALSLATRKGYRDVVVVLLASKADVNAGAPLVTALQQYSLADPAVKDNYKALVELLLANGADVNAKDSEGHTPLYWAQLTASDWSQGLPLPLRQVSQATATAPKPAPASASSSPARAVSPSTAQAKASTSTPDSRLVSDLPFAVKGLVIPPGGSVKTDDDGYIKSAAGLRIESLYLGGTEVPIKSPNLSPGIMIPTRDYGDIQLKFNLNGGPSFCLILVTPKQEETFKTLCHKGQCEYPPPSSTVKLPSSGKGCALLR